MIKLLQFRKLYCYEDENVEEWMGSLCIVAVECNYQEVDRQLKEQFIHCLNDKHMLEEIIKELTTTNNDDHITSGGVLAWTWRVEVQRTQASVLNMLTESRQFDKIKLSKRAKEDTTRALVGWTSQWQPCEYYGGLHQPRQSPVYGKTCAGCGKMGHFKTVCCSKRSRVINEMEQEMSEEYSEGEIETVSIVSIHMNKNQSMLTVELKVCTGDNKLKFPYKIDTGSDGNMMSWHIFKKLFPSFTEAKLKKTIKRHTKLKTYNKTVIMQLGTCTVTINFKDNKKKCEFFVVPVNGQMQL